MNAMPRLIHLLIGCCTLWSCVEHDIGTDIPLSCKDDLALMLSSVTHEIGCGANNGEIVWEVMGGYPPYQIYHDEILLSGESLQALSPGDYLLWVKDSLQCVDSLRVQVNPFSSDLTVEIVTTEVTACGVVDGTARASVTGGTPPFQYALLGQTQTQDLFTALKVGNYTMTITDDVGCTAFVDFSVGRVPTGISWTEDIQPIIQTRCAKAGCHGEGTNRNFTTYERVKEYADRIKFRVETFSMPLDGSLPQDQINMIACWVEDGALQN